jgi:hypothetical protein
MCSTNLEGMMGSLLFGFHYDVVINITKNSLQNSIISHYWHTKSSLVDHLVNHELVFYGPNDFTPILMKIIDHEFFLQFNNFLYSLPLLAKPNSSYFVGGVN